MHRGPRADHDPRLARFATPRLASLAGALLLVASPAIGGHGARRPPFDPMNARDATVFPRAHGAHPGAATEWWYATGIVQGAGDRRIGFELTFFRVRVADRAGGSETGATSAWSPGDLYFAHFAISDLGARYFRYDERIGRTGVALAGADSTDLRVWIRDWSIRRLDNGAFELRASGPMGGLVLTLATRLPRPVAWGPDYVSYKDADHSIYSRYHSFPRMTARGTYTPPGSAAEPVAGTAWYDHEWNTGLLDPDVAGWDWFGLRLGDGRSVMLYRMRGPDGETRYLSGGVVDRGGSVRALSTDEVRMTPVRRWTSPRSGATYPVAWRIRIEPADIGGEAIELALEPELSDQELVTSRSTRVTYWEGAVGGTAVGIETGASNRVEGYMELTGYAEPGTAGGVRPIAGGAAGTVSTSEPRDR